MPKININNYIDNKGRYKKELSENPDINTNKNYEKFNKIKQNKNVK